MRSVFALSIAAFTGLVAAQDTPQLNYPYTIDPDTDELRLTAALSPGSPAFRVLATLARPLVTRGHDWVLDTGARQFVDRAIRPGAGRGSRR